jgi:hypothetical protein
MAHGAGLGLTRAFLLLDVPSPWHNGTRKAIVMSAYVISEVEVPDESAADD